MKIFTLIFLLSISLFAHKLNIFVYEEDSKVITSTYFASGAYCNECKVEVYDDKGNLLEKGLTNKDGEYIVKNPKSKLLIKSEAMGGHGAQTEFEVKNLKHKKEEIKEHNLLYSLIAAAFIALIFLGLKRVKK